MADTKARKNEAPSVASYLAAISEDTRRADCKALIKLMRKITGKTPKMWGTSIVGFGTCHYKYDSGHEGDSCITGFSSRKNGISLYLMAGAPDQERLLARLGKHKMGKGCLSIRGLADVDAAVLEKLVSGSVAEVKRRYG